MSNRGKWIAAVVGGLMLVTMVIVGVSADFPYVEGNQLGVLETWEDGVNDTVLTPGMKVQIPGWSKKVLRYEMSPNIFVMNNRADDERANGRYNDAYETKSSDNQTMTMWLAMQWKYDPAKIVEIHKAYRTHVGVPNWAQEIEERLLRQIVMKETNSAATKRTAIDAYSGTGFVEMQTEISNALTDPNGELARQGILLENFVIEKIILDKAYITEIEMRQVAQQRTLRAQEEEKAATAEALRAKAEAQADYNKQVVEAERERQKVILASEGAAQEQVNAATAEARKVVLAAEAEQEAAVLRAQAILAIGQAEAEAQKLKLSAYAVEGADAFVQIEVASSMAEAFKNIRGYLPGDMNINLLSDSFMSAIKSVVGEGVPVDTVK